MGVRHMQGIPAHLEILHNSDGKRRDKRRCKFYIKPEKTCDCLESPYFSRKCGGSTHCNHYRERKIQKGDI